MHLGQRGTFHSRKSYLPKVQCTVYYTFIWGSVPDCLTTPVVLMSLLHHWGFWLDKDLCCPVGGPVQIAFSNFMRILDHLALGVAACLLLKLNYSALLNTDEKLNIFYKGLLLTWNILKRLRMINIKFTVCHPFGIVLNHGWKELITNDWAFLLHEPQVA